jgi:hypothetical protein
VLLRTGRRFPRLPSATRTPLFIIDSLQRFTRVPAALNEILGFLVGEAKDLRGNWLVVTNEIHSFQRALALVVPPRECTQFPSDSLLPYSLFGVPNLKSDDEVRTFVRVCVVALVCRHAVCLAVDVAQLCGCHWVGYPTVAPRHCRQSTPPPQ